MNAAAAHDPSDHIQRPKSGGSEVGVVELFFDLVFVFAVTQLSHYLIAHQTWLGVGQAAMLFLAAWWMWVYTIWCTNWLDTDGWRVRLILFALMGAGLFVAMAIPEGFGDRRAVFAVAFAIAQTARPLFMVAVMRRRNRGHFHNYRRIASWAALSSLFWLIGGSAAPELTPLWWLAALAADALGPPLGFWTPGFGASSTRDWKVDPHHLAERCGLFVIIALGESLLMTGATFAGQAWTNASLTAFAAAFVGAVGMWWIYFAIGAGEAARRFHASDDPGRIARFSYTYVHIAIVAGIIVTAAADELLIAHPVGHLSPATLMMAVGGPLLFLGGVLLFKKATVKGPRLSHAIGLVLLIAVGIWAWIDDHAAPVVLAVATTAVLVLVAAWETLSLGGVARPVEEPAAALTG